MKKNVLVVFIASPSDLDQERGIFRQEVDKINAIFRRETNWLIEVRGWEDALPGHRRPQEIINSDVDECELFVGMLWSRWGTPTGDFESGFQEEFERAKGRWTEEGKPDIWLLFKKAEVPAQSDIGTQLARVLLFKEQQIKANELFFREFSSENQFADLIQSFLTQFLLKQVVEDSRQHDEPESTPSIDATGSSQGILAIATPQPKEDLAVSDLSRLLDHAGALMRANADEDELSLEESTRLLVASTAWFSARHASEILGTHELHIAFRRRWNWRFTVIETRLVLRTWLADIHGYRPGWFWAKDLKAVNLVGLLAYLVVEDGKDEVRSGGLKLLTQLNAPISVETLGLLLVDKSKDVAGDAITYIAKTADTKLITMLDESQSKIDSSLRDLAASTFFDYLFSQDEKSAIQTYIARGSKPSGWLDSKRGSGSFGFDVAYLKGLLGRAEEHLRRFAAGQLRMSETHMALTEWEALLKDPDEVVKEIAVEVLIDRGVQFDWWQLEEVFPERKDQGGILGFLALRSVNIDKLRSRQLSKKLDTELLESLDFYLRDGSLSYRIVCERNFPLIETRIRKDVADEFAALKTETESRRQVDGNDADLVRFIRDKFMAIAISALADHAKVDDAVFGRKYIEKTQDTNLVFSSVKLLGEVGSSNDVAAVIVAAKSLYGTKYESAIEVAIRLSEDKFEIVRNILERERPSQAIKVLSDIVGSFEPALRLRAATLMINSSDEPVRASGFDLLVDKLNEEQIEEMLREYVEQPSYYYDVVSKFDQAIYMPEEFRGKSNLRLGK